MGHLTSRLTTCISVVQYIIILSECIFLNNPHSNNKHINWNSCPPEIFATYDYTLSPGYFILNQILTLPYTGKAYTKIESNEHIFILFKNGFVKLNIFDHMLTSKMFKCCFFKQQCKIGIENRTASFNSFLLRVLYVKKTLPIYLEFSFKNNKYMGGLQKTSLIARFMGPTWGPTGADRTQVGHMLAPWTLLSGTRHGIGLIFCFHTRSSDMQKPWRW